MSDRTKVSAEQSREAEWNQKQVERFRTDPAKALEHSKSRNERVAQALCYLSLLRSCSRVPFSALVSYEKAECQHFSSSGNYQAAHYLPAQIHLNGAVPWTFIHHAQTREKLNGVFADVEHLPANWNKADSAAELNGLKEAFRMACEHVVRDPQPKPPSHINRQWVRHAYSKVWRPHAEQAFQAAMAKKDAKPHLPPLQKDLYGNILNLRERESATEAQWNIEEQLGILEYYLQSLDTDPRWLLDYRMNELEHAFRP